jgi:Tfp pilus assembly protein PilN
MLWVFIALVILIVSVLVLFLQQIMEAVKNNMYVPPSNAVIDQAMPEVTKREEIKFHFSGL